MVQVFSPSPRAMQNAQIGQSLGQGIGVHFQRGQMQNQQNQIAKALFGPQADQYANLPADQQMKIAEFQQNQQKNTSQLQTQQSLAKQLFPDNSDAYAQLPVQQQIALAGFQQKQKKESSRENLLNKYFGDQNPSEQQSQPINDNQQQTPSEQRQSLLDLPNEAIAALAVHEPQLARLLQQQKEAAFKQKKHEDEKLTAVEKEKRRQFEEDRKYHTKISAPIVASANERLKTSAINKGVREQLKRDIASGNTSGFFPYMVDRMGLESFRNPESARFSNEVKNIFVGSLNEIPGARPNQFLERLLSSAQPQIGRTPEANLSVMDVADFVEDLRDEQARKELEIGKEDREKYGYEKSDIEERAQERMGDFANRRQEKMAMDIRKRKEESMTNSDIIYELVNGDVIPGTYITPRTMQILYIKNGNDKMKALEEAKKLGMVLPKLE